MNILENEFFDINSLTVIASVSYEEFASSLQKEILETLSRETKITVKILSQITLLNKDGEKLKIDKNLDISVLVVSIRFPYINRTHRDCHEINEFRHNVREKARLEECRITVQVQFLCRLTEVIVLISPQHNDNFLERVRN